MDLGGKPSCNRRPHGLTEELLSKESVLENVLKFASVHTEIAYVLREITTASGHNLWDCESPPGSIVCVAPRKRVH